MYLEVFRPLIHVVALAAGLRRPTIVVAADLRIRLRPSRLILSRVIQSVFSGVKCVVERAAVPACSAPYRPVG
jgi:hypothetical protein